jgi:hypothetical protein
VKGCDREISFYAVWCARRVQHLMTDARSVAALDVAERYARNEASDEELASARGLAASASASASAALASALAPAEAWAAGAAAAAAGAAAWAAADVLTVEILNILEDEIERGEYRRKEDK